MRTNDDPHLTNRGVKSSSADTLGPGSVLAAGVDWLTCTSAIPATAELLGAVGWEITYAEADAGNDLRPFHWKGYEGITAGGSTIGVRHDGTMVRLTSETAAVHWRRCAALASNISRIDLAVTVRLDPEADPALEVYENSPADSGERGRRVRKRGNLRDTEGGATTTLGSRNSERYGRLYNKGVESGEERFNNAWRWEVEYKGDTAKVVAREVASGDVEASAVLALTWDQFRRWGYPPVWGTNAEIPPFTLGRKRTDDYRRLEWLRRQVRPVVRHLADKGLLSEVLAALDLER